MSDDIRRMLDDLLDSQPYRQDYYDAIVEAFDEMKADIAGWLQVKRDLLNENHELRLACEARHDEYDAAMKSLKAAKTLENQGGGYCTCEDCQRNRDYHDLKQKARKGV